VGPAGGAWSSSRSVHPLNYFPLLVPVGMPVYAVLFLRVPTLTMTSPAERYRQHGEPLKRRTGTGAPELQQPKSVAALVNRKYGPSKCRRGS